jgi:endonuclease-3 related protein
VENPITITAGYGSFKVNRRRLPDSAKRLRRMHDELLHTYGPQHWWPAKTPFEVVIGAYLTQNTSWKAVERSLNNLRASGSLSIGALRSISIESLQELIRPSGFQTRKAPALKAFIAMLDAEFNGSLRTMAAVPTETLRRHLLTLPNVGMETANAILLYALGHPVPVGDEYLRRIVERHRLITPAPKRNKAGYQSLIQLTIEAFVRDDREALYENYGEFHALTVAVGKAHCGKAPNCLGCPLAADLLKMHASN